MSCHVAIVFVFNFGFADKNEPESFSSLGHGGSTRRSLNIPASMGEERGKERPRHTLMFLFSRVLLHIYSTNNSLTRSLARVYLLLRQGSIDRTDPPTQAVMHRGCINLADSLRSLVDEHRFCSQPLALAVSQRIRSNSASPRLNFYI